MGDDGLMRMRVQGLSSLEELRERDARKLRLRLSPEVFGECSVGLMNLLGSSRVSAEEIRQRKSAAEDPQSIPSGCQLEIVLGNRLAGISGNYLFMPSDQLIDGIRDAAGRDAVKVIY